MQEKIWKILHILHRRTKMVDIKKELQDYWKAENVSEI